MSLRKVYGGTPVGNESRCDTCVYARIIQGYAESERLMLCAAVHPRLQIKFKVMQCSSYEDSRLPSYSDMQAIAWQLRTKSAGHEAGFVKPGQVADLDELEDED